MQILLSIVIVLIVSTGYTQIHCDSIPSNFTGTCSTSYSDGAVKSTTNYANGIKHGEYNEFYHHGELGAQGNFISGSFVGKFERYSPSGSIILSATIDEHGSGEMTRFNYSGEAIMAKGKFDNWKKSGIWRTYNYRGDVLKDTTFDSSSSEDATYTLIEQYGFGEEPTGVYDFPEFDADFTGGPTAMHSFIQATFNYPESALKKRISGRVYVSFVVNEDGSITDAKVVREVHPELDKEALRLVNAMPPWEPAVQGGMRVKSKARLPIHFNVER